MSARRGKLAPCPICGNEPLIDYGPEDHPFDPPWVTCATVFLEGRGAPHDFGCPMQAEGVQAWNYLAQMAAKNRQEPTDA